MAWSSNPGCHHQGSCRPRDGNTLIAIVGHPWRPFWIELTLLLVFCFLATADSMAYAVSVVVTGEATPPIAATRLGHGMGALTALLLVAGDGSINALQQFIVITAVPVTFILLPTAVTAPWHQSSERKGVDQNAVVT